jgi:NADH-quinone oxidoreductase subunit E
VATFYAQFRLHPIGKHLVRVCCGTACHVAGAEKITDSMCQTLDVEPGGTTADGLFTVETVACLGCCSLAPVMMIDDETYGRLDDKSVRKIVAAQKKSSQCK